MRELLKYTRGDLIKPKRRLDQWFPSKNLVGVEVELEDVTHRLLFEETLGDLWTLTQDGSLKRSGVEAVLCKPLYGSDLSNALERLQEATKKQGAATFRTSIHVHLDVRDISRKQLHRLLILYLLLERPLYRLGGWHRYSNNNCTPVSTSEEFYRAMSVLEDSEGDIYTFREACSQVGRYAGCNLLSILKRTNGRFRGSLEFRMHEGTTNIARIRDWIRTLVSLKVHAKRRDIDLETLMDTFSHTGPRNFIKGIFKDEDLAVNLMNYDKFEGDMWAGIRDVEMYKEYKQLEEFAVEVFASQKTTREEPTVGENVQNVMEPFKPINLPFLNPNGIPLNQPQEEN